MEIRHVELQDYRKLGFKDCGGFIIDVPGYFDRRLGKELIAFVARAEGRLVAAHIC